MSWNATESHAWGITFLKTANSCWESKDLIIDDHRSEESKYLPGN